MIFKLVFAYLIFVANLPVLLGKNLMEKCPASFYWTHFPTALIEKETVPSIIEKIEWKIIENNTSHSAIGNQIYVWKIIMDCPGMNEDVILRLSHGKVGNWSEIHETQLFEISNGVLHEVKPSEKRRSAFAIAPMLFGKELYLLLRTAKHSAKNKFHAEIFDKQSYEEIRDQEAIFLGASVGIITIMIFFNIGMLVFTRKIYFAYYVLFSLSCLYWVLFRSSVIGYSHIAQVISSGLIGGCSILFTFSMYRVKNGKPRLYQAGKYSIILYLFVIILFYLGMESLLLLLFLLPLTNIGISIVPLIFSAKDGDRAALIMLLGWLVLFSYFALLIVGLLINYSFDVSRLLLLAIAFEISMSSFASAQRLNSIERKITRENHHAFSQLKKIIYLHQLLEIKNGKELESTMPTTSSQACVISFDIVGSSKIKHIKAKTFFRNVFARCNELMVEGYDGKKLKSKAYRIKEMGDGFLCSVGYPFESITDNPAIEAVVLSRSFARILKEESARLSIDILCGIGIASDTITGFYPEVGTKEYDLYGPGIILATRYEGMRKALFKDGLKQSVLIIQENVYESLSIELRSQFIEEDLQELGIVVRDDPSAIKIYYQFLDAPLA
jgi:hypothetical protein